MASYLQVENISKSYGTKVLFDKISFNINEGDKIALIAPNGTGKSSLLSILAGKDSSDRGGCVKFLKDITISFLEQESNFDPDSTIYDVVQNARKRSRSAHLQEWEEEYKINEVLYKLKLEDTAKRVCELSGGEKKRVAIAAMLINEPDFLIMDEPTNHLDLETIEYLEEMLTRSRCTLLMVTHDRYFLDRVCNQIIELWEGNLYQYNGNYSYFLEKREERISNFKAETDRARNLLRTELDWMRRMPCARGTKAKYRIDAFYDLKERASQTIAEKSLDINVKMSRLGKKIVNCKHVGYTWESDGWVGVDDFTYNFAPGEKIGIVGKNGVGKSTFLNLLTGELAPTSGEIERGETVVFGYYKQSGIEFNPNDTVIGAVQEIAETVTLADGKSVPVTTFLNYFLFPPPMHHVKIEKLSGGEKRRLYLLTVLMKNPNVLILDEPTNDLDILTLNVLEEYLKGYPGSVIIVSHDRFFLDKIADHLFIFEGNGAIKDFVGSYSGYRQYMKDKEAQRRAEERAAAEKQARRDAQNGACATKNGSADNSAQVGQQKKRKLSYKEQRELEQLEKDLEALEAEKAALEEVLSSGTLSVEKLTEASTRIGAVIDELDEKGMRWLELSDI
ncbi:MAG: ABC-F family ATP-binding cassette domain-containing protein [Bacteroidales bacterium]|nr:ABC-F family ATP-binding cassette domain-containing protein [Bacteroidales bacterium]